MNEQLKLPSNKANELPTKLKSTYTLWSDGHDLRSMLPKTTYYRQRKLLMEYGINIDIQPCKVEQSNVVPMFRIVEAKPAIIPKWAFTKNLIHHSAASI